MAGTMANIKGTAASDNILGSTLIDEIYGNAGDDTIDGKEGDDFINGNSGNDRLMGGDGNDTIDGSSGNDWISDGAGDDYVNGGTGDDYVLAGEGNDTFIGGKGIDTIDFSTSTAGIRLDLSKGTATGQGVDSVQGFENVVGTNFSDVLRGSAADEVIFGGGGNDRIRGEEGNDILTGGAGRDTFQFKLADIFGEDGTLHFVDTVTDFSRDDRIDLRDATADLMYDDISEVVRLEADGAGNSTLSINRGKGFETVAVLENFELEAGVPLQALTSDGIILV
jgi:Ca2+-binding RTX toxin-like protein